MAGFRDTSFSRLIWSPNISSGISPSRNPSDLVRSRHRVLKSEASDRTPLDDEILLLQGSARFDAILINVGQHMKLFLPCGSGGVGGLLGCWGVGKFGDGQFPISAGLRREENSANKLGDTGDAIRSFPQASPRVAAFLTAEIRYMIQGSRELRLLLYCYTNTARGKLIRRRLLSSPVRSSYLRW